MYVSGRAPLTSQNYTNTQPPRVRFAVRTHTLGTKYPPPHDTFPQASGVGISGGLWRNVCQGLFYSSAGSLWVCT